MKYYNTGFKLTKEYAQKLRFKKERLNTANETKKIFITLITTYGLMHNEHSIGLVEKVITSENMI